MNLLSKLAAVVVAMASMSVGQAALVWSIDLNDPTGTGPDSTLLITGKLTNSSSSTENLGVIGGTAGVPPGFDFEVGGFASSPSDYLFDWAPVGAASFIEQFEGVDLAPGESFDFEFATLTPNAPLTPGSTYTSSLQLQLFEAPRPGPMIDSSFDSVSWTVVTNAFTAVCEVKIKKEKATDLRLGKFLHIETYNTDSSLSDLWTYLFGADPGTSIDDLPTLQDDSVVTWPAGTLVMGGQMKLRVKTDKKDSTLKEIKIEKAGKKDGTTTLVSGTGGVNPNLADGGWHEVKIKNMDNVVVDVVTDTGSYPVMGFLKELKVKVDQDSLMGAPVVRDFKLKIKAVTGIPDIKKGVASSVTVNVPETVVTALGGTEYEEKVKDKPEILLGHTEAEFDRADGAMSEGIDITTLLDGSNDQLTERVGSCEVSR